MCINWHLFGFFNITHSARLNDSPDQVSEEDGVDGHHHIEQVCVCDTGEDFFHHLGLSAAAALVITCCCYSDHLLLLW